MKMNKSTSDNLIDLYTRIPDYSEVQHLGQSDFINTLEKLKEEFRQCRASLYNEEFCSDSEYLAEKTSTNSRSKTTDNLFYYSSKFSTNNNNNHSNTVENKSFGGLGFSYDDTHGKATKINNHNLTTTPYTNCVAGGGESNQDGNTAGASRDGQYLSVKSCELHRTPYRTTSASSLTQASRYLGNRETKSFLLGGERARQSDNLGTRGNNTDSDDYEDDEEDEGYENAPRRLGENDREWSVVSSNSDISMSKWSSSPEICRSRSRSKEFLPPYNVEQRILQRKSQNNSAPSVAFKDQLEEPKPFKANPVPDHVYKPLYEFIMLKNQRRSERIREQSKRRLMSQVKPFSFCKDSGKQQLQRGRGSRSAESLNNTKPLKKKRNDTLGNIKTNNNRLNCAAVLFRAKPAPPRTRALLAAIRQKEQQDYRELKKRLRAETLLKNASLPPSMAAREKRTRITNAKIDEVLHDYQKSFSLEKRKGRNYREQSTGTEDTGLLTDEDRMTDDDYASGVNAATTKRMTTIVKPFKLSQRTPHKFTSFGTSRHSAAAAGVFEASSNDNHASRLRYQAAKLKEQDRIKREEDEMLKIMRGEKRRKKLRDAHLHAWEVACSYSAEQDIAMRRQLRHAASILERETFIRDMSCMLSRVRSAPLLLEGGNRLERKQEPCKKHRDEFRVERHSKNSYHGKLDDRPWNKLSTPRLYTWSAGNNQNKGTNRALSMLDRFGAGDDKSETAALAEGSLSDSDNESSDGEHDDDDVQLRKRQSKIKVNDNGSIAATDAGSSELEDEISPSCKADCQNEIRNGNKKESSIKAYSSSNPSAATDNEIEDVAGEDEAKLLEKTKSVNGAGSNGD